MTVPSATAAANPDRVNADGRGRAITASRSPAQSSRSAAVPVDPIRSKRPTETASPSWTHSIEPVAMRAPVRGEDGRTSGEVGAATTTSEGEQHRSRPRENRGHNVRRSRTMVGVDTRRLPYLVEFARHGSMRVVAEVLGTSTSVVSQQIAALAREVGAALVEPAGRRSRLTPEGRRLAEHARTILAAVETAELDLDPDAEPHGVVRVAGFATAVRRAVVPTVTALAATHPQVGADDPRVRARRGARDARRRRDRPRPDLRLRPGSRRARPRPHRDPAVVGGLGARGPERGGAARRGRLDALGVVAAFAHRDWIGNSRNRADEQVLRTLASMAGVAPRLTHEADSLELVEDLILAGLGVGLLPRDRRPRPGVEVLALAAPGVRLRAYAVTRRGRAGWPALALVLDRIVRRADHR